LFLQTHKHKVLCGVQTNYYQRDVYFKLTKIYFSAQALAGS